MAFLIHRCGSEASSTSELETSKGFVSGSFKMDSCDGSTSRPCLQGSSSLKPWITSSSEPWMGKLNAVNARDSNDGAALNRERRLIERLSSHKLPRAFRMGSQLSRLITIHDRTLPCHLGWSKKALTYYRPYLLKSRGLLSIKFSNLANLSSKSVSSREKEIEYKHNLYLCRDKN